MPIDLGNIKTQIQSILNAANTTSAAYDLSTGLTKRVASVLKIHPGRIPIQANYYPYVTSYIERKEIELRDFALDQQKAKRKAPVTVKVVGGVHYFKVTDVKADLADNECEALMENVEQVIRNNATLNGICEWTVPKNTTYHNVALDEGVGVRIGVFDLEVHFNY